MVYGGAAGVMGSTASTAAPAPVSRRPQQEFATGVMRNEVVQNAAADAAAGAARGAVTGQYGSNNRY
nr:hypothetical protein BaRGS_032954 [Batillaria attramentaria]